MGDLYFPASLKPIVNKGYSYSRGSNIYRNTVQGGLPRQGRDTYFEPVPIQVNLVTSALGNQVFQSFLNNIHGGADSFNMTLDTGLGLQVHQVMITSDISVNSDDGINWNIGFTATAERTAIQEDTCLTANLPDLYGCYGDFLGGFLKAYGEYMTTFPRVWEPNVIAQFNADERLFRGIGFARASDGTYIENGVLKTAAADVPRYEADGLLLEPTSTNILTYSDSFNNAKWIKTRSVIAANATAAPDGSMTADKLGDNGIIDANSHVTQPFSPVDGILRYSASVFVKAAEVSVCTLALVDGGGFTPNGAVAINLITGAISGSGAANAQVLPLSNGWWRVSVTGVPSAGVSAAVRITLPATTTTTTDGIYVWGAQDEQRGTLTSHIPTTATSASRSADILTLTAAGAKRVYREYTPLGSNTAIIETVPYAGELCPPGHVRVIKVLND